MKHFLPIRFCLPVLLLLAFPVPILTELAADAKTGIAGVLRGAEAVAKDVAVASALRRNMAIDASGGESR